MHLITIELNYKVDKLMQNQLNSLKEKKELMEQSSKTHRLARIYLLFWESI